ncbi:MAG TPA: lytic transglycosylase domain-containing protein, partial [Bradyrhizobium sp.]|nr:lytic transglycosylase domain-containing protein [Bradyrhizobium sp.]
MTPFAPSPTLRRTALGTSALVTLALAVGLSALAVDAWAKPKVPMPKPRPIARNVVPKTPAPTTPAPMSSVPQTAAKNSAPAPNPAAKNTAAAPAAPAMAPATRQHAALPPAPARRPVAPAAVAATTSTSQSDTEALENVIDLIRKHKPADATQAEAAISDPVAKKLAEWIILRSDDNGASVERYRAFIAANPSWPSQSFLRRRLEAALWDDHRDDATVWAWFENESPLSAKGRFSLARVMIARGDRANAERLVREAWRNDTMSEDTESTALDLFGALLTPGDHKARMDMMLYGSEQEAGLRAAKRLGAAHVALAKARNAAYRKAPNTKALLDAVPHELHGDPGYIFSRIQLLRREEKFAEAGQLMLSAPKDPGRLY